MNSYALERIREIEAEIARLKEVSEPPQVKGHGGRPSPWTPELEARLRSMHAAGISCAKIAAALGNKLTEQAVINRAQLLGLKRERIKPQFKPGEPVGRPTSWTADRIGRARRMLADGASYSQIGEALGVSRNSISGLVDRVGLTGRSPRRDVDRLGDAAPRPSASKVAKPRAKAPARAKLALRSASAARPRQSPPLAPRRLPHTPAFEPIPAGKTWELPEDAKGVSFLERRGQQCKWPVGDDWNARRYDISTLLCCGQPVGRGSYCDPHRSIAYREFQC